MKVMRFFLLTLAVAFAANEKCNDIDGDASADTDTFVCGTGYSDKADLNVDISGAADDNAKRVLCCDAKTQVVAAADNANSDLDADFTLTIGGTTTKLITCDAGYSVGGGAATTDTYTATIAADGDSVTGAETKCLARTYQSATVPGSNYATAQTVTFGVTPAALTCATGYTLAKNAAGDADATITIAAVDAATGLPDAAFTFSDSKTKDDICGANTYADVTPGGLGVVANSNYAADVSVTIGTDLAAFACTAATHELAKKADGTTAVTVTLGDVAAADGAFTITSDDDNDPALTGANLCVAKATDPASSTDPASGADTSAADSAADKSATSPAALAAAGMAAIALLL